MSTRDPDLVSPLPSSRTRALPPGRARLVGCALGVALGVALVAAMPSSAAEAAVPGRQGLEIEGPMDRRGFYIGVGAGGGAYAFGSDFAPAARLDFALGGGVTKRLTLGVNTYLNLLPTIGDFGVSLGADLEARIFVWEGLFVGLGGGVAGVPTNEDEPQLQVGVGGLGGLGYEFFLNATAAMAVDLHYDIRAVPGGELTQGVLLGVRFSWY